MSAPVFVLRLTKVSATDCMQEPQHSIAASLHCSHITNSDLIALYVAETLGRGATCRQGGSAVTPVPITALLGTRTQSSAPHMAMSKHRAMLALVTALPAVLAESPARQAFIYTGCICRHAYLALCARPSCLSSSVFRFTFNIYLYTLRHALGREQLQTYIHT
jgi:hypothetical protein